MTSPSYILRCASVAYIYFSISKKITIHNYYKLTCINNSRPTVHIHVIMLFFVPTYVRTCTYVCSCPAIPGLGGTTAFPPLFEKEGHYPPTFFSLEPSLPAAASIIAQHTHNISEPHGFCRNRPHTICLFFPLLFESLLPLCKLLSRVSCVFKLRNFVREMELNKAPNCHL